MWHCVQVQPRSKSTESFSSSSEYGIRIEKYQFDQDNSKSGRTIHLGPSLGRKPAGPTRTTGLTRQQDSSTLPCRQGLTLLTIPSLDCSSVWLLILMLLLFLPFLSLPYRIFHSTTTPYLLASYISLPQRIYEKYFGGVYAITW